MSGVLVGVDMVARRNLERGGGGAARMKREPHDEPEDISPHVLTAGWPDGEGSWLLIDL